MNDDLKLGRDVVGALGLAGSLAVIGLLIGDPGLGLIFTLIDFVLVIYAMTRVPVRMSMMALMFLVFVLPNPSEGTPTAWSPPFTPIGAILLNHLNTVDRDMTFLASVSISGLDILLVVLIAILFVRKSTRSTVDSRGRLQTPRPLVTLAWISIGGTMFVWLTSLLRGGDFGMSLWQVNCVIYLPVLFLLFQSGLRGPKDHKAIAKVLLSAATYKCVLAVCIVTFIEVPANPETGSTRPPYATSHNDSMLFAAAFVLILALVVERTGKNAKWLAAIFLPTLVLGTVANNRRVAWVQVGLVFLTVYFVSRESQFKRKLRRALVLLAPVVGVYCVAGWDSLYGATFRPVRMIRSVVDAKSDGSSMWRELENVDLIATFRNNPLFGVGYGHPYEEMVVLPPVDYPLERYLPHNGLLGLWCYTGVVGYATLTLLWVGGVYFAMRAYYKAEDPANRAAALVAFGCVLIYLLQTYGDLGLGSWTGVFLMSCSIAVAGKVAVASGQWGGREKTLEPKQSPTFI